jgi:hypothetical protein
MMVMLLMPLMTPLLTKTVVLDPRHLVLGGFDPPYPPAPRVQAVSGHLLKPFSSFSWPSSASDPVLCL